MTKWMLNTFTGRLPYPTADTICNCRIFQPKKTQFHRRQFVARKFQLCKLTAPQVLAPTNQRTLVWQAIRSWKQTHFSFRSYSEYVSMQSANGYDNFETVSEQETNRNLENPSDKKLKSHTKWIHNKQLTSQSLTFSASCWYIVNYLKKRHNDSNSPAIN